MDDNESARLPWVAVHVPRTPVLLVISADKVKYASVLIVDEELVINACPLLIFLTKAFNSTVAAPYRPSDAFAMTVTPYTDDVFIAR